MTEKDIRRFCELWCQWNINLRDAKDVLYLINKEKLFEPIMTEEWMKVCGLTQEEYDGLSQTITEKEK